mgnify:FL=1
MLIYIEGFGCPYQTYCEHIVSYVVYGIKQYIRATEDAGMSQMQTPNV